MKGADGIDALRLVTLNKLISKIPTATSLFFTSLFASEENDSDSMEWEIEYGSAGMTPFVAPGAVAPKIGMDGIGEGNARAAYMKESFFLDEEMLNNMREAGTDRQKAKGERQIARQTQKLRNRMDRRREWMMAQAILHGGFSYLKKGGTQIKVSYGIPETHIVTLATDRNWIDGAEKNILEDVLNGKQVLADDSGVVAKYCTLNSTLLKKLMLDSSIQALLTKSAFGNGDLFQNPKGVIGALLGVGELHVFDEYSEIDVALTATAAAGQKVISLTNPEDIGVGSKLRIYQGDNVTKWSDVVVESVDINAGTVTVKTNLVVAARVGVDSVRVREKLVKDNEFIMWSDVNADGMPVCTNMLAPFGNGGNYGVYMDHNPEFDPEGLVVRIQNKSMPVVYHPDCSYKMYVYTL